MCIKCTHELPEKKFGSLSIIVSEIEGGLSKPPTPRSIKVRIGARSLRVKKRVKLIKKIILKIHTPIVHVWFGLELWWFILIRLLRNTLNLNVILLNVILIISAIMKIKTLWLLIKKIGFWLFWRIMEILWKIDFQYYLLNIWHF